MHFSRISRKKRRLLLQTVPAKQKKPPREMSRWCPPVHNVSGREHQWYEACYRAHGAFCGCGNFINHLVDLGDRYGFHPGPRAPGAPAVGGPPIPLRRALPPPAAPEPQQGNNNNNRERWPGDGGDGGAAGGSEDCGDVEPLPADELDGLLAALEDEE